MIDKSFTPDAAAGLLMDGTKEDLPFLPTFPNLPTPYERFEHSLDGAAKAGVECRHACGEHKGA